MTASGPPPPPLQFTIPDGVVRRDELGVEVARYLGVDRAEDIT